MPKLPHIPNPFRFIYQHSGILRPVREYLAEAEDVGDYFLAGVYLLVVGWCLYTAAILIPLNEMLIVLAVMVVLVAIKLVRARRRDI